MAANFEEVAEKMMDLRGKSHVRFSLWLERALGEEDECRVM